LVFGVAMPVYRGVGLLLLIAGLVSAASTYVIMGLIPLLALWIGVAIVGASMYLTPVERTKAAREISSLVNNTLANMAMVLEAFNIGSNSVYVSYGDEVYIYIANRAVDDIPGEPPKSLMILMDGEPVFVLRSPFSRRVIEGYNSICPAIEYLVIDLLDIADDIKCIEYEDRVVVEVKRPYMSTPHRLEKTVGSIYGIIASSVVSLIGPGRSAIEADIRVKDDRRIVVKKVGKGEK